MSRSNWLYVIALGGCLALGAGAITLFLPWANHQYCKAPGAQDRPAPGKDSVGGVSPKPTSFERVASALEAIGQATDPPDKTQREISDLAAQQDMSCWAFWMMAASFAQVFVGVFGTIALVFTILQGRKALGIGQDSVVATRESTAVTLAKDRAFVFVDDIVFERDPDTTGLGARIVWKNGGATPTKAFRSYVNINYWVYPLPKQFEYQDIGQAPIQRALVGPQATMKSGLLPIDSQYADVAYQRSQKGRSHGACLLIWGWCEYNDVFAGTKRHRTEFCREVIISNPGNPDILGIGALHFPTTKYNNTDDECLKPLQTNPPHDGS